MRVAALYDVHGNLPALEAVLAEVRRRQVDRIVVGGDVYPGPLAERALDLLLDLDLPVGFLHGNGDRILVELASGNEPSGVPELHRASLLWAAERLKPEHRQVMAAWPATLELDFPSCGAVLFCHATPRNDTEIFTRRTPDAVLGPVFEGVDAPLVICGHTHMPFDRRVGDLRVVNAGSVGMSFGSPDACWLLLEGEGAEIVAPQRTAYDLKAAAERIRASEDPGAATFAESYVLTRPTEAEALDMLSAGEIRPSPQAPPLGEKCSQS